MLALSHHATASPGVSVSINVSEAVSAIRRLEKGTAASERRSSAAASAAALMSSAAAGSKAEPVAGRR